MYWENYDVRVRMDGKIDRVVLDDILKKRAARANRKARTIADQQEHPWPRRSRPARHRDRPADTRFFGHPRGLSTLFFTEMWERFSYYGMRALLILFMTAPIAAGGLGFDTAKAGPIYGLIRQLGLPAVAARADGWPTGCSACGGPCSIGGVVIMVGHICLAIPVDRRRSTSAWLVIAIGTGLLKPNISAMVGELYAPEDERRDAGFSIYYMGINIGAFIAPLIMRLAGAERAIQAACSRRWASRRRRSWHWGFGAGGGGHVLRARCSTPWAGSICRPMASVPCGRAIRSRAASVRPAGATGRTHRGRSLALGAALVAERGRGARSAEATRGTSSGCCSASPWRSSPGCFLAGEWTPRGAEATRRDLVLFVAAACSGWPSSRPGRRSTCSPSAARTTPSWA